MKKSTVDRQGRAGASLIGKILFVTVGRRRRALQVRLRRWRRLYADRGQVEVAAESADWRSVEKHPDTAAFFQPRPADLKPAAKPLAFPFQGKRGVGARFGGIGNRAGVIRRGCSFRCRSTLARRRLRFRDVPYPARPRAAGADGR
jgi:hypothetical protein